MVGIVRIYQDAYGKNMGARTFCQLSKYFGGVLITDNKKIQELDFKQITHEEALANRKKFTKIIVYNTKPNMFGGVPSRHTADVVRLILSVENVYYYNCDPILSLPKDVADSHERQVPGLRKAIHKLNNDGIILDRTNTDLTKYLAACIDKPILNFEEKQWISCYFGDARGTERQKQVNALFAGWASALIVGHEHTRHAWFDYDPNFYRHLNRAWTTPIIGDQKLHYDTGIPSIRLYEAWHTSAIALVDRRFNVDGLDDSFYFSTVDEFRQKTKIIGTEPLAYERMLKIQRKLLKQIKKRYANKTYDWSTLRKHREQKVRERKKLIKNMKKEKIAAANKRLELAGIKKGRRLRVNN